MKNEFSCLKLGRVQKELVYGDGGSRAVIRTSVFDTLGLEILLDFQMGMSSRQIFRPGVQGRVGLQAIARQFYLIHESG